MFIDRHPLTLFLRFPAGKILCYSLFFFLASITASNSRPLDTELSLALEEYLGCLPIELIQNDGQLPILSTVDLCLAKIYHQTGARPLWVTVDGPSEKGKIILKYLTDSDQHGLEPNAYKLERLRELWSSKGVDELAELDILLTYNIVKYVHDISYGRLKPLESDPQLFAEAGDKEFNPLRAIEHLLATRDLDRFLAGLPPQHLHYKALKTALAYYRNFAKNGDWPKVAMGVNLHPGDREKRIISIRKRLQFAGPFLEAPRDSDLSQYDLILEEAVLSFQQLHGLQTDGIIGRNTVDALNISIAEKIEIIRLNMMRWRWQAHDLGKRYLLVNIASFNLKAFRDQDVVLDMPIIVGTEENETPVFSAWIKYIDFNPFWNIPTSIARNEMLPALRKNNYYLIDQRISLFSNWQQSAVELDSTAIDWEAITPSEISAYKLRQDPGPLNALGRIKFIFPNSYSVYMHDTPGRHLFSLSKRSFSHGCIRVSDPLSLAIFLLENQTDGWDTEKIKEIYEQEERKVIILTLSVAVHITYGTAWVDKGGEIHFSRDIYLRDERLRNALLK
ncbi:L,D-transpeptidase family protein [Desulfotalea psychrophila]|uniref:L,D-TPase catalytic domain-containing protein n=1 Tax=Desulfotalea psychrophila (strain LSv54 / DSM 12343) TaxID=177439 RepID=Q6APC7_DESPS|nr:L,D-transpeptidase family protein [Desulfotalea psychrophila]CAG35797.1 hypothetical protein DP1068 [Desulfotalea psychrophila LSv54]